MSVQLTNDEKVILDEFLNSKEKFSWKRLRQVITINRMLSKR